MAAFSNALENVLFPVFSSISSDLEALKRAVKKALLVGTYLMVFVSFLLIITAEPLIQLLLTEKWLPSVPVFQLTCLTFSFCMLQIVNLRAYMALGDSGLYMKLQIVKVVFGMCVITLVAVLTADIYWVAATNTAVSVANILIIDLHPAKKRIGIGRWEQIKLVSPCFFLGLTAAVIAYPISYIDLSDMLMFLIQFGVFSLVYLGASRVLKMKAHTELIIALKEMRRKREDNSEN